MEKPDDDISQMPMWKSYLYHLQQQAPKPKRIPCQKDIPNRPPYYGREYHGAISREDADFMLTIGGEGSYLIRESQRAPGQYTLAIRFDGMTKNFKLYFDNQHYVGEKRFDAINDLVADGLITFYLESKAADYIAALSNQSNYAESPYVAYNTHKKHQHASSSAAPKRPPRGVQSSGSNKRQEPPPPQQPQQSAAAEQRFVGPRSSSDIGSSVSGTGDVSLSGAGKPNIPIERSRLSQIVEQRRSQDSQQLQQQQKVKHADDSQRHQHQSPAAALASKQLPPTPSAAAASNRQPSASRGVSMPAVDIPRVTSSTNTDGPMFEDQQFLTPPSSPPVHSGGMTVVDGPSSSSKQVNSKLSSVTWCNDYLEVMGCEKQHNFKLYTFKGPHWCDFCANFLWGLIAQGVKCQDCGFNAHKKCSEKVPNDCMPDMKYVKRMFGVDLTTLVKAQSTLIPAVVEMCVKEIEARGVESEGLYRVAGFHDDVEAIRMSFDKDGEMTDISEDRYDDLNTIASVLKLYFRLLPIPLITFDVYFKVIDIVRREDLSSNQKLDHIKHSIELLPPAHYHTLKYLISHLFRVTEHQQQNMMNAENLAIVFAPTLLRSPETDPLFSLSAVKYERELIELMIINHSVLFE